MWNYYWKIICDIIWNQSNSYNDRDNIMESEGSIFKTFDVNVEESKGSSSLQILRKLFLWKLYILVIINCKSSGLLTISPRCTKLGSISKQKESKELGCFRKIIEKYIINRIEMTHIYSMFEIEKDRKNILKVLLFLKWNLIFLKCTFNIKIKCVP